MAAAQKLQEKYFTATQQPARAFAPSLVAAQANHHPSRGRSPQQEIRHHQAHQHEHLQAQKQEQEFISKSAATRRPNGLLSYGRRRGRKPKQGQQHRHSNQPGSLGGADHQQADVPQLTPHQLGGPR